MELRLDDQGRLRQRLPVHIIKRCCQEQHEANGPFPSRGPLIGCENHASHSLPSQSRTRFKRTLTSALSISKRISPLAFVATLGKPMWPGTLRSFVTQARDAGANALPNGTGCTPLKSPTNSGRRRNIIDVSHSQAWPMYDCVNSGCFKAGSLPNVQ